MKLIKPGFEILEQKSGMDGVLSHIELCGRTAYKSEDKITLDSAAKFVEMLIKRGHGAVLEHGTIYLSIPFQQNNSISNSNAYWLYNKYTDNMYSIANQIETKFEPKNSEGYVAITTNYRVLVENNWLEDLQYLCEPTEYHVKRISVKFICDRGVSHEFVRHRVFSFVQESTRFCNYSNEKFDNELTFIEPCWRTSKESFFKPTTESYLLGKTHNFKSLPWEATADGPGCKTFSSDIWRIACLHSEMVYLQLLENGWLPQQARSVLPNSLKTELIMTGTIDQWKGFFKLRCAPDAHPQARELAIPLEQELKNRKLI